MIPLEAAKAKHFKKTWPILEFETIYQDYFSTSNGMISKFTIHKLDCHSCSMVIEGICEDTQGVNKAEVNSIKRTLTVEHDETVSHEVLQKALKDGGYSVEPASSSN